MRDVSPATITAAFDAYAEASPHPRLRAILGRLAAHLHAFVVETGLTHDEWREGLAALTRAGAITTAERNEFVLFSDLFGVSALVDMVNTPHGATSCSNMGPFHRKGAPALPDGGDFWRGQAGEPLVVLGRVIAAETGEGVPRAVLDLWQNADNGLYAAQDPQQEHWNYHGTLQASADGSFALTTTRPRPYQVPYDGPAGDMLRALKRDAWRPAHLHIAVQAPGRVQLVTELFPEDDEWLDRDAVFGVRPDLVLPLEGVRDRTTLPPHLEAAERLPERFLVTRLVIRMAEAGDQRRPAAGRTAAPAI